MPSKKILASVALLFAIAVIPLCTATSEEAGKNKPPATSAPAQTGESLPESGIPKTWLQGNPVSYWEKDKVYVFEFWATWCGPCLAAIPHLEAIHKEISRENLPAQLIGVNVHDRFSPEKLKDFLAKRSTPPSYAVAIDSEKNAENNWLKPLGVRGIPFAVAVKNGKILWKGHPMRLSAEAVRAMTREGFSPGFLTLPQERETEAKKRVANLRRLFRLGEIETAHKEIQKILDDNSVPESQKIEALETPAFDALSREEFRKMNAALRRLAEAFPQNHRCQIRVADFVQTTDDVPADERDFSLAIECLNRALALKGSDSAQRGFICTKLAEIYKARGDADAELSARKEAWEFSAENIRLETLRKKLAKSPEKNRKLLALFDDLASGRRAVPVNSFVKKNSAVTSGFSPDQHEISTSPEARELLAFLKSLRWIQGKCPESLPKNGVLFIDFWTPPPPGPYNAFFDRKPAEIVLPGAKTMVIAVERQSGRAEKVLAFPRYSTPHPVCVTSSSAAEKMLSEKFKFPGNTRSHAAAVRDGKMIWSGSAQDFPDWLTDEAVKPDYDHEKAEERRAEEHKNFLKTAKEISEIHTLVRQSKFAEARERLNAIHEETEKHPSLDMRAAELRISEPFSRGDFVAVGKICEDILKKYPHLRYVAEYQMKILTSSEKLRAQNLSVLILACKNILAAGTPYETEYLGILSGLYEEAGDLANAVYSAFAAREASEKFRAFKLAKLLSRLSSSDGVLPPQE